MSSLTEAQRSNARLGLWLFAVYLVLYLVFVLLSAFAPALMERRVLAGLNLAIVYGFALIIGALLMALLYGVLCKTEPLADKTVDTTADARGDEV
ncbi:DUF485 domain-containing protein [Stieleria sp. TO1_6]|nr:DUF485 domain-containing protein [Stieleria tagensis]